ncbi:DNA recombination protein RmuC [Alteromonas lipolytica]|uniref:Recombinase RmuC n=1 Tax=Alteromonas lipolytica TaxID=1856405 RepID=A0A1E8FGR6_9ALTE|nr:DNA recombination protein RmuC [Alteromonas lipolytica]OFI35135.1 recombinase RmuC [Alteromonas lipolytica]GGF56994.1 DNA recombination protein RmuC [Alteromonas lipolytica]
MEHLDIIIPSATAVVALAVGLAIGRSQGKIQAHKAEAEQQLLAQQLQQTQQSLDASEQRAAHTISELKQQLTTFQQSLQEQAAKAALLPEAQQQRQQLQSELKSLQTEYTQLKAASDARQAAFDVAQQGHEEKLASLQQAEKRLQEQFENLANRIFQQKAESFSNESKNRLDALLNPLKDQIEGFKKQVTDQYVKEGQERASLKTEILGLKALNQQITEDAAALTRALKGDNKQQGNWGEVVLERILKESGLREGHEFETQVSARNEQGKLQQPDVVVHLPNDKDVIIDSKVSLASYERYFNSDNDDERARYLKEHVNSLRSHIKGLGAKDYHELEAIRSLDYVLMFIPVEPAFLLAVESDPELVTLALNNNIMLVSPTNLLVALRTINNIWQYEYQNQNAQKIAQHAAKLYDKFAGFVGDMEKIGKSIESTQKHYDAALNKLSSGRGNLVRQVEQFRALGVQPSKRLAGDISDDDSDEQD